MANKYAQPETIPITAREWPDRPLTETPVWCAVDLRDGNQALPDPMSPAHKRRYYQILLDIGFKEIEVGFPAASADDFEFCRELITQDLIPADVTISVLTQAREHLIQRTMEALRDVKRAICHVYIATSDLHMRFVFAKTPAQSRRIALDAVRQIRELANAMPESEIHLEFSPEEFTDSNLEFVVELCDRIVEIWDPAPGEKVILNLPATVERRPPHHYADMIETFRGRQQRPDATIISIHTHNDMGGAVASSEMALMAGAERVEGTLFGHGERSGNVDLVTLALNLQYLGVDTGLHFDRVEAIRDDIADLTGMPVHPRHPYVGELVFTAFSGSHQDAIHKGLNQRQALEEYFGGWKIPYIHIDPRDIGRNYERFIRINSQSGKGGIAHVLQKDYGIRLPRTFLIELSRCVQEQADSTGREIRSAEVWELFLQHFAQRETPLRLLKYWPRPHADDPAQIDGELHLQYEGEKRILHGSGAGPIAAFVRGLRSLRLPQFSLEEYEEDAIGTSADAEAVTFVRLEDGDANSHFGVGFGSNIDQAAVRAVTAAINALLEA